MNRTALGVIIAIILVVLVGGLVWYSMTQQTELPQPNTATPTTSPRDTTTNTEGETDQDVSVITYTDNGFSPSTLTVKAGDTITIKNDAESPVQFSSDDHPTHREHPEINMQVLQPGGERQLTIAEPGTYMYHDHLDPNHTGTIIVTD